MHSVQKIFRPSTWIEIIGHLNLQFVLTIHLGWFSNPPTITITVQFYEIIYNEISAKIWQKIDGHHHLTNWTVILLIKLLVICWHSIFGGYSCLISAIEVVTLQKSSQNLGVCLCWVFQVPGKWLDYRSDSYILTWLLNLQRCVTPGLNGQA